MQLEFSELRDRMVEILAQPSNEHLPWGAKHPDCWQAVQDGLEDCRKAWNLSSLGHAYAQAAVNSKCAAGGREQLKLRARFEAVAMVYEGLVWLDQPKGYCDERVPEFAAAAVASIACERMKYAPAKSGKAYWQPAP